MIDSPERGKERDSRVHVHSELPGEVITVRIDPTIEDHFVQLRVMRVTRSLTKDMSLWSMEDGLNKDSSRSQTAIFECGVFSTGHCLVWWIRVKC